MVILGIETSCDETAAAVVKGTQNASRVALLSNFMSSSLPLHAKTGGIIPEVAARAQIEYILPVIKKALKDANFNEKEIDAIAVTNGPGLIGSLLVGVETAKTLSYIWKKPIVPVNHLIGHIYANFVRANSKFEIRNSKFPALALVVSGGHTDLVLMKKHGDIVWLGGTRDDAAGEAFDKIGRLFNLPYPAGPTIEKLAKQGNPKAFRFPRPMIDSDDYDFSFSGLKTAALRLTKTIEQCNNVTIADISASVQQAIIDVLVKKTLNAAQKYNAKSILLGGGVAANEALRNQFELTAKRYTINAEIFVPQKFLCTDNGAMIATAAFFNYNPVNWQNITANPELYFD
ncbi:MAG: tRNA (adenosine(37)-N6)-threonylcarbamoyltransferase complex transferase subunit TsaD [Candidatus Levybacteria bacterium]|nr:tRNA (adenosine(37)-N6)-threonylcarbamoyltransferase complex transferase subunit TsaD [Candidatus Levybacteria bacterium]